MKTKEYDYSEDEYISRIIALGKHYDNVLLFYVIPWMMEGNDMFFRTKTGIERYHCCFNLEYLFRTYLQPGWQWNESYTLMCKELEETNLYIGYCGMVSRGTFSKVPKDIQDRIIEKINSMELKRMMLMYRGYSKTTIFSMAHSLQEIIIHPDIRTLIMSGSRDLSSSIVEMDKSHFMFNIQFRSLFPEYCPKVGKTGKIDFGTQTDFTVLNRTKFDYREPTIMAASPDTKLAGLHFTKIIYDDLIDKDNVTSPEQLEKAKQAFQLSLSLFENPAKPVWDMLGTRYHEIDLYGDLQRQNSESDGCIDIITYDPVEKKLIPIRKKVA